MFINLHRHLFFFACFLKNTLLKENFFEFFFAIRISIGNIDLIQKYSYPLWFRRVFFPKNTLQLPPGAILFSQDNRIQFYQKKQVEITILQQIFMWKEKKMEITIFKPILILEKCKKIGLLFLCKLKIQFFVDFTMYNVYHNLTIQSQYFSWF